MNQKEDKSISAEQVKDDLGQQQSNWTDIVPPLLSLMERG